MAALAVVSGVGKLIKAVSEANQSGQNWAKASIPGAAAILGLSGPKKATLFSTLLAGIVYYKLTHKPKTANRRPGTATGQVVESEPLTKNTQERSFFQRLGRILNIIAKGPYGRSVLSSLICLSVLLILRTLLSIQVAVRTGNIAEQLVQQNWEGFVTSVGSFLLMGVPAAFVNSLLKYFTTIVALYSQKQISDYIHARYIQGTNFYKATQLPSSKIDNVDQRVTADVQLFCQDLASLYSSVFKPVLDIILNTWKLSGVMGFKAPFMIFLSYLVFGKIQMSMLQNLDIKNNTKKLSEHEGTYRTAHSRLIVYAEEIAFFEGSDRERGIIGALFDRLFDHHRRLEFLKAVVGVFDQFLLKYGTSITGYALMSIPVFFRDKTEPTPDTAALTRNYVLNRQLLMDLSIGIGTLLSTATTIASFAGITQRVSEVLEKVDDLNEAHLDKANFKLRPPDEDGSNTALVSATTANATTFAIPLAGGSSSSSGGEVDSPLTQWLKQWRQRGEDLRRKKLRHIGSRASLSNMSNADFINNYVNSNNTGSSSSGSGSNNSGSIRGSSSSGNDVDLGSDNPSDYLSSETFDEMGLTWYKPRVVVGGDRIRFFNAGIVSPDGRLLVKDLNLTIERGTNVMITGPNGCGKSSLFRVLGELWPPYAGTVVKPSKEDILFVPQKPYLVNGTLRDQIIYPHTVADMRAIGVTDDDLVRLLEVVDPAQSIVREWKFDDQRDWFHSFSGGQKQRVAMARVFYHRPRYAILDECTSAVSADVEGAIYRACRTLQITIFTVSHRPQLQQFHDIQVRFDGHGNYSMHTTAEIEQMKKTQLYDGNH